MAETRVAPIKQFNPSKTRIDGSTNWCQITLFHTQCNDGSLSYANSFTWLHSSKQLKQFIANRVNSIRDLFPASIWHYCPTQENPADILTHGLTTEQMLSSSLWKNGPAWLMLSKEHWPSTSATRAFQTQSSSTPDIVQNHSTSTLDAVQSNPVRTPKAIETNPLPINPTDKICKEYGIHSIRHCTIQQLRTIIANHILCAKVYRTVKKTHKSQTDSAYS